MTRKGDARRIPEGRASGSSTVVRLEDFDTDLFVTDRAGRVTLNPQAIARAIGRYLAIPDPTPPPADPPDTFQGAGTTGLVPDPGTETGLFLQDDGTWQPASGSGAPVGASYIVVALDGTLTNERNLAVGASLVAFDNGPNNSFVLVRAALTGDVTAGLNSNATTIAAGAVTYAKIQNVSAASKLLGSGSAGAGAPPTEIALGAGLTMTGTTLSASGGTTPTGTGFRHVTAGVEDAAAKLVDTADVNNSQITNAKLADMAAATVKGRASGAGTGAPTDLARTDLETILGITSTPAASSVPKTTAGSTQLPIGWIPAATSTPAVLTTAPSSSTASWRAAANTPAYLMAKDGTSDLSFPKCSGTTFPTSPVDGQLFFHTTHQEMYRYSSAAGGWLSVNVYQFAFGAAADVSATNYVGYGMTPGIAGQLFTDTYGHSFDFAVKCVGLQIAQQTASAVDLTVFDDGAAVTGAVLSTTAKTDADHTLLSNTIAAASVIGVKVTSGTLDAAATGHAYFRRFET